MILSKNSGGPILIAQTAVRVRDAEEQFTERMLAELGEPFALQLVHMLIVGSRFLEDLPA